MTRPDPAEHVWWLASRAAGVTALLLVTASTILGLAMATKVLRGKVRGPVLARLHEHLALGGLLAIAVHAITLIGDPFLRPGLSGILVPFSIDHEPVFSALGIVAADLAALVGLTFYVRRRIGPKRWRSLHRLAALVYVLGVVHALGAGTDAGEAWLQSLMIVSGAPVLFLLGLRLIPGAAAAPPARAPAARA